MKSAAVLECDRLSPVEPGPCRDCGGEPTRTLGRFAYCADCADEIISEIRGRILARDGIGVGVICGHREPDLGPYIWQLACSVCRATWSGRNGDPCPWCVAAAERQRLEQRRLLLFPDWLHDNGPRYNDLSAIDRAVWDRTRCQVRGAGSIEAWAERLARAVQSELITEKEARTALARAERTSNE